MKIKIINDVFNICNRLKSYNRNYYILFNKSNEKFEVHNSSYKNSLCAVLPFKNLDIRAINYILKNEKVEEVLKEIETNNQKLEKRNLETLNDRTAYQFNEIFNYSNSHVKDFDGQGFKNDWI